MTEQLSLHVVSWWDNGWNCTCGIEQKVSTTVVARTLALWHAKNPLDGPDYQSAARRVVDAGEYDPADAPLPEGF